MLLQTKAQCWDCVCVTFVMRKAVRPHQTRSAKKMRHLPKLDLEAWAEIQALQHATGGGDPTPLGQSGFKATQNLVTNMLIAWATDAGRQEPPNWASGRGLSRAASAGRWGAPREPQEPKEPREPQAASRLMPFLVSSRAAEAAEAPSYASVAMKPSHAATSRKAAVPKEHARRTNECQLEGMRETKYPISHLRGSPGNGERLTCFRCAPNSAQKLICSVQYLVPLDCNFECDSSELHLALEWRSPGHFQDRFVFSGVGTLFWGLFWKEVAKGHSRSAPLRNQLLEIPQEAPFLSPG